MGGENAENGGSLYLVKDPALAANVNKNGALNAHTTTTIMASCDAINDFFWIYKYPKNGINININATCMYSWPATKSILKRMPNINEFFRVGVCDQTNRYTKQSIAKLSDNGNPSDPTCNRPAIKPP